MLESKGIVSGNCGIDFGTSNSALSYVEGRDVRLALLEDGKDTLPSALFYPVDSSQNKKIGRQAVTSFIEGEEGRFMRSLKRILGTSLMVSGTVVNGKNKKFEDILKDFISQIKRIGEEQAGKELNNVVLGRPVRFIDKSEDGDKRAEDQLRVIAKKCGFKNIAFQYEPIAAAFSHERLLSEEKLALVVDIGGGTSDFTVIRLSPERRDKSDRSSDILSNVGIRIGGNDFDKSLCMKSVMPEMGSKSYWVEMEKVLSMPTTPFLDMSEWSKINFLYNPKFKKEMYSLLSKCRDKDKFSRYIHILDKEIGHEVLSHVEDVKIELSAKNVSHMDLSDIDSFLSITISQQEFKKIISEHIKEIKKAISGVLRNAGVSKADIELVILTGGTTEVPAVQQIVRETFPQVVFSEDGRLSSVGLGLGYDSLRRF